MAGNKNGAPSKVLLVVAFIVAALFACVSILVVMGSDNPKKNDPCSPTAGSEVVVNVPAGATVKPMRAGTYQLTSGFGPRWGTMHQGQDLAGPGEPDLLAFTDATVREAGEAQGFGQWIILDFELGGKKYSAVYGHMFPQGVLVKTGDKVKAGQVIGKQGNNGDTTGPHLHFEIWEGGRLDGGKAVDPAPFLASAVEAGGQGAAGAPQSPATDPAAPRGPPAVDLVAQTNPLQSPYRVIFVHTTEGDTAADAVQALNDKGFSYHVIIDENGAVQQFRPDAQQAQAAGAHANEMGLHVALVGRTTTDWAKDKPASLDALKRQLTTWSRQYNIPLVKIDSTQLQQPTARGVAGHADASKAWPGETDHTDPGENFPWSDVLSGTAEVGCTTSGGAGLDDSKVPPEFAPWIKKAAALCPEITAPLIAAQLENESGFRTDVTSDQGAIGPSQFIPSTWEAEAVDGDGDGKRDPRNIADAVMSQGTLDCKLVKKYQRLIAEKRATGDPIELMLSAYNCGEGATDGGGRVCQNSQTLNYVKNIPNRARTHFAAASGSVLSATSGFGNRIVEAARSKLGVSYAWAGGDENGPTPGRAPDAGVVGFDCSGLTLFAIAQAARAEGKQLVLPHLTTAQNEDPRGKPVPVDAAALQPGDLLFVKGMGHVAIFAGNGKVIDAPESGKTVQEIPLNIGQYESARRFAA
ncbi:hypothetical protein AXK57_21930 [Tsukamurella pulmonis]|uniref:peptidoglycan DD-metalloendopeptidase family protein n=1 Tax=Tsukamurella pulmonis TaxID=47312 RepID=UPI00079AC39A|nr:peptidoglycan DD-metalloendopeptidase family protein [Tsukamurella pulmonis]KXP11603.1 hypothetical protein AXK57_21930 [Tsukamurella pulmonis]